MIFRVFLVVLLLAGSYIIYDTARLYVLKNAAQSAYPAFSLGPQDAEFTIVEFLDYSCGKCQKSHPALKAILAQEKNLLYIPRPILSDNESGNNASRFVYAAGMQGKFIEAHNILIENTIEVDQKRIDRLVQKLKLDGDKIKADMDSPAILKQLKKNKSYNKGLGSPTIPAFLINGHVFWIIGKDQIPTIQDFKRVFNEARIKR